MAFEGRIKLSAIESNESWSTAKIWRGGLQPAVRKSKTVSAAGIVNAWIKSLEDDGLAPVIERQDGYLVVRAN